MKKVFFLSLLLTLTLGVFGQLKVINNFGKDLNVESGGKALFIPNHGAANFATRSKVVTLACWSTNGQIKFNIQKKVSRSGVVKIEPSDNVVTNTNVLAKSVNKVNVNVSETDLSYILEGGGSAPVTTIATSSSSPDISFISSDEYLPLRYLGSKNLKIISYRGQGVELSAGDSLSRVLLPVKKGADLVIGVGEKRYNNQAVWPYAEIRKYVGTNDTVCVVTDADIKMLATGESKKVRFKVEALGYKVLIETDEAEVISLGHKGISQLMELPLGQSYIRIAYTDSDGEFHPTAFMPVHITQQDRVIIIDKKALSKTLTIKNF